MLLSLLALTAAVSCLFAFPQKENASSVVRVLKQGFHLEQRGGTNITLSSLMASLIFAVIMCKCFPGQAPHYLPELLTA